MERKELKDHPKWLLWKAEPTKKDPNKLGKVPYQANGRKAQKNNPDHWCTFEQAKAAYLKDGFDGIGVAFIRADYLTCVDLDDFEDINNIPVDKHNLTQYSYTEFSPSGNGLHIWIKGKKPEWVGTNKNGVEFYGSDGYSFLTVTGDVYNPIPVADDQKLIDCIAEKYFKEDEKDHKLKTKVIYKVFPDDVVLTNMFSSKNGEKIRALFYGSTESYESASEADLALSSHFAYWTNYNPDQMDRLFRKSTLFREKWDEKRHGNSTYGKITIEKALKGNNANHLHDSNVESAATEFITNKQNKKIVCLHNTQVILNMLEIEVYYDVIKKRSFMKSPNEKFNGDIIDFHVIKIMDYGIDHVYIISKNLLADHLMTLARDHSINKISEFFERSKNKWDGKSRIEEVFNTLHSRTERNLGLAYFKKWCIQAVRLANNTAGKMNQEFVLVLQGGQGVGKTTWVKMLFAPMGEEYFKEGLELNPDNKDSIIECISYFIVELGELDATMKHEQSRLKAFITRSMDEVRKPFERLPERTPRQTILFATVNEEDFLKDKTGNRRYAVIKAGEQIDRLTLIDLDQFWGEIATLAADGDSYLLTDEEKAKQKIENIVFETMNEAEIRVEINFDWEADKERWQEVNMATISEILGLPSKSKNVGQALKKKGCVYNDKERPRTWTVPPFIDDYSKGFISKSLDMDLKKYEQQDLVEATAEIR